MQCPWFNAMPLPHLPDALPKSSVLSGSTSIPVSVTRLSQIGFIDGNSRLLKLTKAISRSP
jgi:hypothetical protein